VEDKGHYLNLEQGTKPDQEGLTMHVQLTSCAFSRFFSVHYGSSGRDQPRMGWRGSQYGGLEPIEKGGKR
jgi:hypothetical protein